MALGVGRQGKNHHARCIAVQPVHQQRGGKHRLDTGQQAIGQVFALARHRQQPGRLRHDEQRLGPVAFKKGRPGRHGDEQEDPRPVRRPVQTEGNELLLRQARRPELEAGLVLACGILGTWFDSLLVATSWVGYPSGQISPFLAPYWIITMWMLFATTLNRSMGWLRGRLVLASVLGAIAGPASYIAGQKLGGIEFREPVFAIAALAIGWAVVMPLLMMLAERLDGFRVAESRGAS